MAMKENFISMAPDEAILSLWKTSRTLTMPLSTSSRR